MEQVKLSQVGKYILKKPAVFTLTEYPEEELWSAVNHDMMLRGFGETKEDAIQNIEEDVDDIIHLYANHKITTTPESEAIRNHLETHFGISELIERARGMQA